MTEKKLLNEYLDINKKPLDDKGYLYDMDIAIKSIEIADEFAIGFAEWCIESEGKDYNKYKYRDRKELLEIYKKEKGL